MSWTDYTVMKHHILCNMAYWFLQFIIFLILEFYLLKGIRILSNRGDDLPNFVSKRWCCENAALNMPANLENSAVATGLEKLSFHSNPKERQCQRMLKLLHNCANLTG